MNDPLEKTNPTQTEYFKDIVATIREPLVLLDADLRVLAANRSFYKFFRVKAGETIGQLIYDLGNRQWDIPGLRLLLETILPKKADFHGYNVEHDFPVIGRRILLLNARRISRLPNKASWILLAFEDITERMELERKLLASEERFRRAFETAQDGMLLIEKARGQIVNSNQSAEDMLGYSKRSLRKKNLWELGILKDEGQFRQTYLDLEEQGVVDLVDKAIPTRDGENFYADVYLMDRAAVIQCNIRDISERKQAEQELRIAEEKYRTIFENVMEGIFQSTPEGRFITINPAFARMLGYESPEEVIATITDIDRQVYLESPRRAEFMQMMAEQGSVSGFEFQMQRKDGGVIWVSENARAVRDGDGTILYYEGKAEDITERKRAEEALRESEQTFRSFVEESSEGFVLADEQGMIIEWNHASEKNTGLSAHQVIGKPIWDAQYEMLRTELRQPDNYERSKQIILKALQTGQSPLFSQRIEGEMVKQDGVHRFIQQSIFPIKTDRGYRIGSITSDITERKRAEEVLRSAALYTRSLIEASIDPLVTIDPDGKITDVNRATETVTGVSRERLIGDDFSSYFTDSEKAREGYKKVLIEGMVRDYPLTICHATGKTTEVLYTATVYKDAAGKVQGIFAAAHDITERKRAEVAVYEQQQVFRTLVENSPDIIARYDHNCQRTFVNSTYLKTALIPQQELLTSSPMQLSPLPAASAVILQNLIRKVLDSGVAESVDVIWPKADNIDHWYSVYASPEFDREGRVESVMTISHDITERKQMEQILRENEQRLSSIYATVGDVIYFLAIEPDEQYRFSSVNPAFMKVTGLPVEQVIGRKVSEVIPEPSLSMVLGKYRQAIREKGIVRWEETSDYPTGRLVGDVCIAPVFDEAGNCTHLVGSVHDITERKRAEEKFEEERILLRTLIDNLPDRIYIMDGKGRKTLANIADLQAAGGKTMEDIIGKTDLELYPPELAHGFWAADRAVIDSGMPIINLEEAGLDSHGKPVSVLTTKVPLRDGQGKIIGLVGNGRDITERKKAEETLLRSQQETTHANQLLLALSQAAQAVQRVRTQEEVYAAIQEQMTQLGYNTTVFELADEGKNLRIAFLSYASNLVHRAEKMTGLSMHDYRIRPRQGSIYQRVLKQGETVYVENGAEAVADALPRRLRPLAKPIAGLLYLQPSTFTPLLVGDERIGVFSVTGLDLRETDNIAITIFARQAAIAIQNARLYEQAQQEINERKLAEEALIYERNLLNALMDNIPDHIYFKDIDSRFIRMNRAQANGFGISNPVQAMGKTDFDFFTEQHARPAFENEQEIIKTGRPMVNFEETETYSDGRMATVSTTKIPFRNPDGQIIGTIGISRDITERKQAESKLKEYSEHLEEMVDERTRDLRQARDKLVRKEKLAVLGQLAGSVGHELRNPLGVISNSVYYLKMVQPDVNEKIKNHHAMIEEEVHNAAQIVSDLLDYAREISTDPKLGSVPELVEHTLSRFPVPASVQVSLKIPADLPQVYADPLHVEQVLGNLITNGCQAMISPALNQSTSSVTVSSGGKLTITARRQEQMVAIAVKDTGIGILPENKEKLFEPLFSTKINGIGLGLAVSKKLAEANGGRIELESEAGKGSTFTLYLPVIEGS